MLDLRRAKPCVDRHRNAEQLGKDLDYLIRRTGTAVAGAGAAAEGGVTLTNAAVNLGAWTSENAALQFMKLPMNAQVGVVGAQDSATGGGNQLHFIVPPRDRASVFRVVGERKLM